MAYSYAFYNGDGVTTNFGVPFPYINQSDISVKVNGSSVSFSWVNGTTLQVVPAPALGTIVFVKRTTSANQPVVDYTDGSLLSSDNLNLSNDQLLYIAQEALDAATSTLQLNAVNQYDALTHSIINVKDPVNAQDAATKNYVDSTTAASAAAAAASATAAATSATAAATSATAAANSATDASNYASQAAASAQQAASALVATSSTNNVTIATGSHTFAVQAGKEFQNGMILIASDQNNANNFIVGTVSSYSGTSLVINGMSVGGAGTPAGWNIAVSGSQGPQGQPGTNGTNGQGVPVGGTAGQVLQKNSSTNYDTSWVTQSPLYTMTSPVRQSVLGGASTNGSAAFLSTTSGLTVNLLASASTLTIAFAAGYSSYGPLDYIAQFASDQASYWSNIQPNNTTFLSVDRNSSTGVLSATQSVVTPQYGSAYNTLFRTILNFENNLNDDWGNSAWSGVGSPAFSSVTKKFGSYSLQLSGTGQYVNSARLPPIGAPFTIEGVFNASALPSTSNLLALFAIDAGSGTTVSMNCCIYNSGGTCKTSLSLSPDGSNYSIAGFPNLGSFVWTTGGWHHVAIVFTGSQYILFVDGVPDITVNSSTKLYQQSGSTLRIGSYIGNNDFNGFVDSFRFDPFARYTASFTPPASALTPDGDWFDTVNMVMKSAVGAGPTWSSPIQRLYVGEAVTSASAVTSAVSYALKGEYIAPWTAGLPAAGSLVSVNDNLGTTLKSATVELLNILPDQGYVPGDVVGDVSANDNSGYVSPVSYRKQRNSSSFNTGQTGGLQTTNISTGVGTAMLSANWAYRMRVKRAF